MQKMNERIEHERYCKDIEYEDLRSYTRKLYEQKEILRRQNDSLTEQLRLTT